MKLTLTLTSHKGRYERSMRMRTLVSCTVLASIFVLVSSRSTDLPAEQIARVNQGQAVLDEERRQVSELAKSTQTQLNQVIAEVARLESVAAQLALQNQRLASALNIEPAAFEFAPLASEYLPEEQDLADDPVRLAIKQLDTNLALKQQQLDTLESLLTGHHIDMQSVLSGRPVESGWLSSYYGMRADPFTGKPAMHKGLDFAGETGDKVVATAAGIVTWAGERYGYGQLIEIEHGDGVTTRYGHNQSLLVEVGQLVTKGQAVAVMGSTGRSTGAHVHYEVIRNGRQVDPLPYVY